MTKKIFGRKMQMERNSYGRKMESTGNCAISGRTVV